MPSTSSLEWITAYLTTHSLSRPSRCYALLLWLAVAFVFLVFTLFHWTGFGGGSIGAAWSKWSLRRRTWRKKWCALTRSQRAPISFPSNAQLLSLAILVSAVLALAFVGPDYLAPSLKFWSIRTRFSSSPSRSYATPTLVPPQHTISKSLWSSSARTGQIAFALFPLCVVFALKAPPFAIFAVPFTTQLHFDKLALLHKWVGRLAWFLTLIHVVLWSIQLAQDVNPSTGRVAYVYAWSYTPFIFGWIAFGLFTLIVLLSVPPIRRYFYESFYILHVLLVPCMLVTAGLHHPAVAWWCWIALALWVGERLWRGTWWIYINGLMGGVTKIPPSQLKNSPRETWEMDDARRLSTASSVTLFPIDGRAPSPLDAYYLRNENDVSADRNASVSKTRNRLSSLSSAEQNLFGTSIPSAASPDIPPPGYVHAELMSGRVVRLRLVTPGFLPWSPGQHFLLNIPSVSRFTSHPFTCASVCDEAAPTDAGRIMLFLVRAKGGWTQSLWNLVSRMIQSSSNESPAYALASQPKKGVFLRAYIDGPFGSAKRAKWEKFSTGIIIAGGTGVSFGLSVLQYMCMCLAGRDGRELGSRHGWRWKGAALRRVRFIWLVREYSHIQWGASVIRRCMSIVPASALQVDIYVTNFIPVSLGHSTLPALSRVQFIHEPATSRDQLQPPNLNPIREGFRSESTDSVASRESWGSDVDLGYYLGESSDDEPEADEMGVVHETNMLDLTNFDGDVDLVLPGEAYLSRKLKEEGKIRRLSRRSIMVRTDRDARSSRPSAFDNVRALRQARESRQAYPDQHRTPSRPFHVPQPQENLTSSAQPIDGHPTMSSLSERLSSSSFDVDFYSQFSHQPGPSLHPSSPSKSVLPPSDSLSIDDRRSSTYSAKGYPDFRSESGRSGPSQLPPMMTDQHSDESYLTNMWGPALDISDTRLPFRMDEQEATDVSVVSEHARPGKPKLAKVIEGEVQASEGPIVVACCGPTSLNVMVRKIVAAQIDPGRIRRGDMRGSIALVSEEFEY